MTFQHGIRCPNCHEDIYSNSADDFVECSCGAVFIDGGFDHPILSTQMVLRVTRILPASGIPRRFRDERRVKARPVAK